MATNTAVPEKILACKTSRVRADANGDCPSCGGDACLVRFTLVERRAGEATYRAWFLSAPGLDERQVDRHDWLSAERAAGFHPKPGCGPEATGSFGTATLRGHYVDTTITLDG